MAETLEAMARALFYSLFVDFDPVRAKIEGQPTGLPEDVAALFPGSFGENGIPLGWRQAPIVECFDLLGGDTPKTGVPEYWAETYLGFLSLTPPPSLLLSYSQRNGRSLNLVWTAVPQVSCQLAQLSLALVALSANLESSACRWQ